MKIGRITHIVLGVVSSLIFLNMPSQVCAQDIRDISPSRCTAKQTETDGRALPIARNDQEYKKYGEIVALQLPEEMIEKGECFLAENDESDLRFPLYQHMVTSAIRLNNFDLAFEIGRKAIEEFPDHVLVKTQLATVASNLLLMGNNNYGEEGECYAHQALSFILQEEKTPYGYTIERWRAYREGLLGDIYQAMGIFSLLYDCPEDSINALARAVEINPNQPYSYFLMAKSQVRLYQLGMRKSLLPKTKVSVKQPETLLEQIAKSYAYVSVLTENEQYKMLRDAAEYDMQILSNALGTSMKAEFAKSIDTARSEMSAVLKPAAAVATERP